MDTKQFGTRVLIGAAAGAVTSALLVGLRSALIPLLRESMPQSDGEDSGEFIDEEYVETFSSDGWKESGEDSDETTQALIRVGYGAAFGALYGTLQRDDSNALLDGVALGAGQWAIGSLGWLPGLELEDPDGEHSRTYASGRIVGLIARHLISGIGMTVVHHWLTERLEAQTPRW